MDRDAGLERMKQIRERIDEVDREILGLINERTRVVEEIGRIKQALALPIYEPKREEQVFANVVANNSGPLPHDAVKRVFERIIDEMRAVQRNRMIEAQMAQASGQSATKEGNS